MFLDKLSKRALNAIGIISAIIATIMLILVIVIPILMKRKYKNDYIQKCNPSMENTDIWASFPGKLNRHPHGCRVFYRLMRVESCAGRRHSTSNEMNIQR